MMSGDIGGIDLGYGSGHMHESMRGNRGNFHGQERYNQDEYNYGNNEEEFGPNRRERQQDQMMNDRYSTGQSRYVY
jgi:hypothetical protein